MDRLEELRHRIMTTNNPNERDLCIANLLNEMVPRLLHLEEQARKPEGFYKARARRKNAQ